MQQDHVRRSAIMRRMSKDKMKKVGVVTIFRESNNFGAALQAYALQRIIMGMGYEADVIDIDFQSANNNRSIKEEMFHIIGNNYHPKY